MLEFIIINFNEYHSKSFLKSYHSSLPKGTVSNLFIKLSKLGQFSIFTLNKLNKLNINVQYQCLKFGLKLLKIRYGGRIGIWGDIGSHFGEVSGHDCHELLVADASIAVLVGVVNHLVDFGRGESLPHAVSHSLEVLGAEGVGSIGVEHLVELLKGLLGSLFTLAEDGEEGGEVKFLGISVGLDNGNDVGGLALHVEGPDGVDDFLHGDLSAVVIVEQVEHLLELGDSLRIHALVGVLGRIETLHYIHSVPQTSANIQPEKQKIQIHLYPSILSTHFIINFHAYFLQSHPESCALLSCFFSISSQTSKHLSKQIILLQLMGKLQKIINLVYFILFLLAFKLIMQQYDAAVQYPQAMVQLLHRYIANDTLSPGDFPPELVAKDITHLTDTEAFVKLVQLGMPPLKQESGLSLNNRYDSVSAGEIITILLSENPTSEFLQQAHNAYVDQILEALPYKPKQQNEICIFVHVEQESNDQRAKKLVQSILNQKYDNFNVVYIDDAAEGTSFMSARTYVFQASKEKFEKQFIFESNQEPLGFIANLNKYVRKYCSKDSIVLILQGEDYLASPNTLQIFNAWYTQNQQTGVVSGKTLTLPYYQIREGNFPPGQSFNTLRTSKVQPFLQTFRFEILDKVKNESLVNPNTQEYFRSEAHTALFYSLVEAAGEGHFVSIDQIAIISQIKKATQEQEQRKELVRGILAGVESSVTK